MTLTEILLSIALSLPTTWYPPGKEPETAEEYKARMQSVVQAITLEAEAAEGWRWDTTTLAAATLVTWYAESKFSLDVHNGSGKTRFGEDKGKAKCLGQLHQTGYVPKEEWRTLTGTDLESTRRCARATMRVLTAQANRCGAQPNKPSSWVLARMWASYMTGKTCTPFKGASARAGRWTKVMKQIKELVAADAALADGRAEPALVPQTARAAR